MEGYMLIRYIGEVIVPEDELEEVVVLIRKLLSSSDTAPEAEVHDSVTTLVLMRTEHKMLLKVCKPRNIYYVYLDFKSKRAEVATLSATLEVIE